MDNFYVKHYYSYIKNIIAKYFGKSGISITKGGGVVCNVYNRGKNNSLFAGKKCFINNLNVKIIGSNNSIHIGDNVRIREKGVFTISGNNCRIIIGDNTSMTSYIHLECTGDNRSISVGNDCMFSNHIHIRTDDSHPIYIKGTDTMINEPKDVNIGNHVWIAANVIVLKGVTINDGSIVGTRSVVTHDVPSNSLAVGVPAKTVKSNVEWTNKPK